VEPLGGLGYVDVAIGRGSFDGFSHLMLGSLVGGEIRLTRWGRYRLTIKVDELHSLTCRTRFG
ncbi:MAG: hypothetical protein ACRETB_05095, partial [Steroidobacteraceae bacterium]